ncbi:hypothetical protein HMPREF0083_05887, partial [Aneurinibacillus aneurinilyticus ATCC 12856]
MPQTGVGSSPAPKRRGPLFAPARRDRKATFYLSQAGPQNIWVEAKRETIAVLSCLARAIAQKGRRKALFVSR